MFRISSFYLMSIFVLCLLSCVPDNYSRPTVETPSLVFVSPTFTVTSTETVTPTLPATLTPLETNERIKTYLQKTVGCLAPCFWGITPEKTTFDEAMNIISSIGLRLEKTNARDNQEFYATTYHIEKGFEITVIFTVQDDIIKTLDAGINVPAEVSIPRKWSAYSPETLISEYGTPSKVEFFLGRVTPTPTHSMILYFENAELIIAYIGSNLLNISPQLEFCPLTNQVENIQIWLGKNPRHPPIQGVSLEEATSLTLEDFSKLMLGDPNKACFNLKDKAFP
jgi:hypothetical protein